MSRLLQSNVRRYYVWLLDKVDTEHFPANSYSDLLHLLFSSDFYWTIERDENRAADGIDMRKKFENAFGLSLELMGPSCNLLEMFVGLARRCASNVLGEEFETGVEGTGKWFWIMMDNLTLTKYTDEVFDEQEVSDILNVFISRSYNPDGTGGLFPLANPPKDQRKEEIWFQLNSYLIENYLDY